MRRSLVTSLTMVSLAMIVAPCSAQQPATGPTARAQPAGVSGLPWVRCGGVGRYARA